MIHTNRVCQRASSLLQKYKDKGDQNMKRRTLCIVLAFVMALGLMGCSSGDTSSDSSTDGEQAAVEYPTRDLSMIDVYKRQA